MGMPALMFPASGICQAEGESPSFFPHLFFLLIQRIPAGGYLPGSRPNPSAVPLVSRFPSVVCKPSLCHLLSNSEHTSSTEPHSPRGLQLAIYRQSSRDENFQRALVRPLQEQKMYGSC